MRQLLRQRRIRTNLKTSRFSCHFAGLTAFEPKYAVPLAIELAPRRADTGALVFDGGSVVAERPTPSGYEFVGGFLDAGVPAAAARVRIGSELDPPLKASRAVASIAGR
jgi:hypothetical protein